MLLVLGYVIEDSEGRYVVWSQRMGFHYARPYQITPNIFVNEAQAMQHNEALSSIGTVKPVYIEMDKKD